MRVRLGVVDAEALGTRRLEQRLVGAEHHERPRMAQRRRLAGAREVEEVHRAGAQLVVFLRQPVRALSCACLDVQNAEDDREIVLEVFERVPIHLPGDLAGSPFLPECRYHFERNEIRQEGANLLKRQCTLDVGRAVLFPCRPLPARSHPRTDHLSRISRVSEPLQG